MENLENTSTEESQAQEGIEIGDFWEGLLYVIIMIVVLGGALMVPGVTIKGWIIGLFGSVIFFNIVICVMGIWKNIVRVKR